MWNTHITISTMTVNTHSHEGIEIIDEIVTENGIKHMHVHKHALLRQSCEDYHG
jgi:hypothetical protein